MNVAIINCFDTYEHRVDLLHDFFVSNGDAVKVYASDFRHFEKVKRTDNKEHFIYIKSNPYYKNISPQRLWSHHKLARDVFKEIASQKLDLLWVLVPPNSFVKEAANYKKKHPMVKLVFDIIDMWPETMPIEKVKNLPPVKMWKALRDDNLVAADFVVTECLLFQEALKHYISESKMKTIYLAREVKLFESTPQLPEDKIALCYLGSINNIIDIRAIEEIIKELSKIKPVELNIIGDGEKKDELIDCAKQAGATVIYYGKVYDSTEKQRIFDSCHYGLNIMKETVFVGLTMKSIDYFEAGLPIINNIKGDTWKLVEEHGLGVNVDNILNISLDKTSRKQSREFFESSLSVGCFRDRVTEVLHQMEGKIK